VGCSWMARRGDRRGTETEYIRGGCGVWMGKGIAGMTRKGSGRGWCSIHAARSLVLLLLLLLLLAPRSAVLRVLLSNRAYRRTGFRVTRANIARTVWHELFLGGRSLNNGMLLVDRRDTCSRALGSEIW